MIHLVTIVPMDIQKPSGHKFLHDFKKQVERCMVHVKAHVEVNLAERVRDVFHLPSYD